MNPDLGLTLFLGGVGAALLIGGEMWCRALARRREKELKRAAIVAFSRAIDRLIGVMVGLTYATAAATISIEIFVTAVREAQDADAELLPRPDYEASYA